METSITEQIFRTLALLGVLAIVILLGWNEPLKYRFMSRAEIYALENPVRPVPAPQANGSWMTNPGRRTQLDRGPYNRTTSVPSYGNRPSTSSSYWSR